MRHIAAYYHLPVPASSSKLRTRQFDESVAWRVEVEGDIASYKLLPCLLFLLAPEECTRPVDRRDDLLQDVGEYFRNRLIAHFGTIMHKVGGLPSQLFLVEGEYIANTTKVSVRLDLTRGISYFA